MAVSRRLRTALCVFVSAFLFGTGLAGAAQEGRSPAPATERGELQRQLDRCKSAWRDRLSASAAVRYRIVGEATDKAGSHVLPGDPDVPPEKIPPQGLPRTDSTFPVSLEWLIDFDGGRFRRESHWKSFLVDQERFIPLVQVGMFDGEQLTGLTPREANSDAQFTRDPDAYDGVFWERRDLKRWVLSPSDLPVLYAHGLFDVNLGDLKSADWESLGETRLLGWQQVNGANCVVVSKVVEATGQPSREDRYFLDPQRQGAILRQEHRTGGVLLWELDIQWSEHPEGIWVPESWQVAHHIPTGSEMVRRLRSTESLRVESVDFSPSYSGADFQMELKPGMVVLSRADGRKSDVLDGGKLVPHGEALGIPVSRALFWVLLWLHGLALLLFIVWRVLKRRTRPSVK